MRISDWSSDVCSSDLHAGVVERLATLEADVLQQLRHGIEAVEHLAGRCAGLDDLAEDLQARDEAVAGGGVIRQDDVPRLLAADIVAVAAHRLQHMAVADPGAPQVQALGRELAFEPEVAPERKRVV